MCQTKLLIIKMLNVFIVLKVYHCLISNKTEHFEIDYVFLIIIESVVMEFFLFMKLFIGKRRCLSRKVFMIILFSDSNELVAVA